MVLHSCLLPWLAPLCLCLLSAPKAACLHYNSSHSQHSTSTGTSATSTASQALCSVEQVDRAVAISDEHALDAQALQELGLCGRACSCDLGDCVGANRLHCVLKLLALDV